MNKRDIIIIIAAILSAAALLLVFNGGGKDVAVIYVENEEYARIPLNTNKTVTIEQDDGCVNIIEVFLGGVRMKSSTCKNQLCVQQGDLTVYNRLKNDLGGFIICLPNGVSVTIEANE